MLESYIESKLRKKIKSLKCGALCLKFVSPGFTGVPDRIILLPGAPGAAKVIFVELKKPQQTERKRQIYVQNVLRKLGFDVYSSVDSEEKINQIARRNLSRGFSAKVTICSTISPTNVLSQFSRRKLR